MPLLMTSGPASEPVTVAEAKAHLRVDHNAEDALIASLILTSRLHIEAALGLALMTQGWQLRLDAWPRGGILGIPLRPLLAIDEVRVLDRDGTASIVDPDSYLVDAAHSPPRLVPVNAGWPPPGRKAAGIQIDLQAGYGSAAASVPAPIRQALLLLVTHWYEHRDPIEVGSAATFIPAAVSDLLAAYRIKRL